MECFLFLLFTAYAVGVFVFARKHYLAKHGVDYERDTPIFNTSTFVGFAWPAAMFYEPWRNPPRCRHLRHVEARQAAGARYAAYEEALEDERRPPAKRGGYGLLDDLSATDVPRSEPPPPGKPADDSDEHVAAVKAWLEQLDTARSPDSRRLTDELLEVVGPPPLPPQYGSPSTQFLVNFYTARAFGARMSEHYSRRGWLAYGEAEKANDPDAMRRAHNSAQFWDYVGKWFEQL